MVASGVACGMGRPPAYVRYDRTIVDVAADESTPIAARALARSVRSPWLIGLLVAFPLLLTAVLLLWRPWAPVLDMAMTELRVRDVGGRHSPLIGLPGRIGTFPDSQGSHPGPASFYLLAPFYRIAGSSAWGLELGSIVLNGVAVALTVWIGHRRAGTRGALVLGAVCAVAVRGYGLTVLTHPWNPYFPVLLWLLVLVAAWAVLCGDRWCAVIVVVAGSIAAQTHVPYLLQAIAMCVLVLAAMVWQQRRFDRPMQWALGLGTLLWLPPAVDQVVHDPGNIRALVRHFASEPPEPPIGLGTGVRLFFRHLDAPSAFVDLFLHGDAFVYRSGLPGGNGLLGVVVFGCWIAAAVVAYRRRHRPLMALHGVLAVALAVGGFSMLRIFGKVWYYLTLWAWGTMLFVVVSLVWTAWLVWGERLSEHLSERLPRLTDPPRTVAVGMIALATAMSIGAATVHQVPEHQLSDGLRAVLPDTAAALDAGAGDAVGHDGRYLVFWQDAVFIGAQGYGLVNELERRGFDVGVHATWRVPVTPQRVFAQGSYDAEVHLVSGAYIPIWRDKPGFVEVAYADVRTDTERARFDRLRLRVRQRLTAIGRTDMLAIPEGQQLDLIDGNLFGASLDPELPDDVLDDLSEMLLLAEPVAVFIAPPGSSF
jgi:hypothetical protein